MKGTTSSLLFLLATLAYTKATVTVSPENQQPTPCNSCCQGQAGTQGNPGIPGSNGLPGTNGMPGSMGLKGERGESVKGDAGQDGQTGQKGDVGDMGLKGETGTGGLRGPSGKVGPVGSAGSVGSRGPVGIAGPVGSPGVKGQKGQMGQMGVMGQSRLSAFSAARRTSFTPSSAQQALPFDGQTIHTNVGDDFDAASGRFTCEIPGIYLFTYSIMTNKQATHIRLMKNDVRINTIYRTETGNYDLVSNSAVLQLAAGDQVWLKCQFPGRQVYSDNDLYTTFSGVILHET